MRGDERGVAPVELALAVGMLLIPMAILVLSIAPWIERQSMARVAAGEAARVLVLSSGSEPDHERAVDVAVRVAANHGVSAGDIRVVFCAPDGASHEVGAASRCGPLARGSLVAVEVQVVVPAATVPGIGSFGEATVSSRVTEQVDLFRSFAP